MGIAAVRIGSRLAEMVQPKVSQLSKRHYNGQPERTAKRRRLVMDVTQDAESRDDSTPWEWSKLRCPEQIKLSDDYRLTPSYGQADGDINEEDMILFQASTTGALTTAERIKTETELNNPAVQAAQPLTEHNCTFTVIIQELGKWFGIGVADEEFQLVGGKTLGTQTTGINCGYFCQTKSGETDIHKIQIHSQAGLDASPFKRGDSVSVRVHYASHTIYFFLNGLFQGNSFHRSPFRPTGYIYEPLIQDGMLWPTIHLSHGTTVKLSHDSIPQMNASLSMVRPSSLSWEWSIKSTKKSEGVRIDPNSRGKLALRTIEEPIVTNPAIMSHQGFTRSRPHFQIKIESLGKWLGIGVCDEKFVVTDSKTLGTQKGSINSAYFWQVTGVNKLQMTSERPVDGVEILKVNDVVDIYVDFDANKIHYFSNSQYQGHINCSQSIMKENELYPCASMSVGTSVLIVDSPNFRAGWMKERREEKREEEGDQVSTVRDLFWIRRAIGREHSKEDTYDPSLFNQTSHPMNWSWGNDIQSKSKVIEIHEQGLVANRITNEGNNPAVMTAQPFTRVSCYFSVKVLSMGPWMGIGVADRTFSLDDSKTLGEQRCGLNSSYFVQGVLRQLQLFGEKIVDQVNPITVGDVISIHLDFDERRIHYYHNHVKQGSLSCGKHELLEGSIFPCVDMSPNTSVSIVNFHSPPASKLYDMDIMSH
ncbi:hypothetical protein PROFUN_04654 [Planoprotostelium fungivorum]|uniref:B30.2/SPRY domain-containing protein n=1 Tax=Planoprotostelium fungivorum TaxID=1890364 RepID=A0A2P6NUI2_9EUKA|nr:hypothetical protein PROFUN_04654 [Planoprotostelium fungivorum]